MSSREILKRVAQGGEARKFKTTHKFFQRLEDGTDVERPELEYSEEGGFVNSELDGFNINYVFTDPRHCFLPQKNPYRPPLPGEYYTEDELREACKWFADHHGREAKASVFTTFLCGRFKQDEKQASHTLRAAIALGMVSKNKDIVTVII